MRAYTIAEQICDVLSTLQELIKNPRLIRHIDVEAFNRYADNVSLPFRLVKEDDDGS